MRTPTNGPKQPLPLLIARLRALLSAALEGYPGALGGEPEEVFEEARLTLDVRHLEHEATDRWLVGNALLRSRLHQRQRQRRICQAVDQAIQESIAGAAGDGASLRREVEALVGKLPPRCRNLLRLRYGLGVKTDEAVVKLGGRRASVRKVTDRCLLGLARSLIELGLESERAASE